MVSVRVLMRGVMIQEVARGIDPVVIPGIAQGIAVTVRGTHPVIGPVTVLESGQVIDRGLPITDI